MRSAILATGALVVLSGFATIAVRHEHRMLFNALQAQHHTRDRLNSQWHQLLLEQSTWAFQQFVEQKARDRLDMVFPPTIDRLMVEGK